MRNPFARALPFEKICDAPLKGGWGGKYHASGVCVLQLHDHIEPMRILHLFGSSHPHAARF